MSGSAHANRGGGSGGILAAHLAKMNHDPTNVPMGMFDLTPESLHASIMRNPGLMAGLTAPPFPPPHPMKKSRKSSEPRPRGGSPNKDHHVSGKKPKLTSKPLRKSNNLFIRYNMEIISVLSTVQLSQSVVELATLHS